MPGHVHVFGTHAISACSDRADVLGEVSSEKCYPREGCSGYADLLGGVCPASSSGSSANPGCGSATAAVRLGGSSAGRLAQRAPGMPVAWIAPGGADLVVIESIRLTVRTTVDRIRPGPVHRCGSGLPVVVRPRSDHVVSQATPSLSRSNSVRYPGWPLYSGAAPAARASAQFL